MPRTQGERWARFANIRSATFICPHCGGLRVAFEDEINPEGIRCRHCLRLFRPATLEKDRLRCHGCDHRLSEIVEEREGADRLYRFCPGCAADFDSVVAEFDRLYTRLLRGVTGEIKRRRRQRGLEETDHAAVSG